MRLISLLLIVVLSLGFFVPMTEAQTCTTPNWQTEFYNNVNFVGAPTITVCFPYVNFLWGEGSPATGVPVDGFAIRWSSTQILPTAGTYQFNAVVEDGARLYVNGALVFNDMNDASAPRVLTGTVGISQPGATVLIVLETVHYSGNASVQFSWTSTTANPPAQDTGWSVSYFNGQGWSGSPVAFETAPANGIARVWSSAAPAPNVQQDDWSTLWTRTVNFQAGIYTFFLRADDEARVRIDGVEVINQARYSQGRTFTGTVSLTAGAHTITVEHYEIAGPAYLLLTWDPSLGTTILPTGCNSVMAEVGELAPSCGVTVIPTPSTPNPSFVQATVNTGALNFRPAPSSNNEPLGVIYRNATYPAVGRTANNGWVQLEVGNVRGWVATRFVILSGDINTLPIVGSTPPAVGSVQARSLGNMRIRSGPSTSYARLGGVDWGTTVNVIGRTSDNLWIQVQVGNLTGWSVRSWYEIIKGSLNDVPITG